MKIVLKILILLLVTGFLIIQFIQPVRNKGEQVPIDHLFLATDVPDSIVELLSRACLDCHSDYTRYPWYGYIAPVSWFMYDHIMVGKEELNFSIWDLLSRRQKISQLCEMCEEIESKNMPLKGYVMLRNEASLSEQDIQLICDWTDKVSLQILNNTTDTLNWK